MAIVNFSIPSALNQRVAHIIKQEGFASKAEFFRFAAMRYVTDEKKYFRNEDEHIDYLVQSIAKELYLFKGKKIPSLLEQLKNV